MAKLAVFGDSILDKYSFFKSYRTSPEAPVPVINDEVNEYYLGGAALVSDKLIDLGNEVDLYTMIGDSSYSKIFTSLIKDINVFDFAEKGYDVTTKERIIVNGNYFLRKDVDSKLAPNLSDVVAKFSESISTYDGAIFVDYDKGFLNQNLFNLLAGLTSENNITSILDPNINNIQNFHNLDFIKLNEAEAKHFSKKKNLEEIFSELNKINVLSIITLSSKGAATQIEGEIYYVNSKDIEAIDVSGCGDVFLANFISNYILNNDIRLSVELAVNKSTDYVKFFGNKKNDS
jgi:rfaE bifunctional protein kinase chain/domain